MTSPFKKMVIIVMVGFCASCSSSSTPITPPTPPEPVSVNSLDGESGVDVNKSFIYEFTKPIDSSTVTAESFFIVKGSAILASIIKSDIVTTLCNGENAIKSTIECSSNSECGLTPEDGLEYSEDYSICITSNVLYSDSTPFEGFMATFTTGALEDLSPSCSSNSDCATGWTCLESKCKAGCSKASDCSSLGTSIACHSGVCQSVCGTGDCQNGMLCSGNRCRSSCESANDCAPGLACNGSCQNTCSASSQCNSLTGYICDETLSRCAIPSSCNVSEDCPSGWICYNKKCKDSCSSPNECVALGSIFACTDGVCQESCDDIGQCQSGRTCHEGSCKANCTSVADCSAPDEACNDVCQTTCTQNSQCKASMGYVCDNTTKRCLIPSSCVESSDCPTGWVCHDNECKDECSSPNECSELGTSFACFEDICQQACDGVGQCQSGLVCHENSCKSSCESVSECSAPTDACNEGVCQETCTSNSECNEAMGYTCQGGSCSNS